MALSPNYNWSEPDNSSLVKNGAADIRTLGDAIDTSVWNVGFGQAGKNKIINGDFGIWQRGTSFTNPSVDAYLADRWTISYDGSGATRTYSQQTFTPGTAPVAGYEGTYFLRYARTVAGTGATVDQINQKIENVRTFAGQTITYSFWAKVDSGTPILTIRARQFFGGGGSANVDTDATVTLSTTWTRYSVTLTLASISGKTVGTNSYLQMMFRTPINTIQTFDFWGVQLEAGSKATPFQTASGGSIQGELAMCQRYYVRYSADGASSAVFGNAFAYSATGCGGIFTLPVSMRIPPTLSTDYSTLQFSNYAGSNNALSSATANATITNTKLVFIDGVSSSLTTGQTGSIRANSSTSAYIGFSAEL